jgi:hypothetical protein
MARRALPKVEGAKVERGVVPGTVKTVPSAEFRPPAGDSIPASRLPEPHEPASDSPTLSGRERSDLAACEAALDRLRVAFWAAGKALQTIRDARLYREAYGTFEEYVAERWEMSRPQAYRLIDAWPLAAALSPMGDTLNERQVRELLPVADQHGQDAAVTVYRTIAETDGVRVTAAVLKGAVGVLPADRFDPEKAVEQIRAYLAGEVTPSQPVSSPGEQLERFRGSLRRIKVEAIRAAGPEAVRELAGELRALADEMEQGVG